MSDESPSRFVKNEIPNIVLHQVGSQPLVFLGHSQTNGVVDCEQKDGRHHQRPGSDRRDHKQLNAQEVAVPSLLEKCTKVWLTWSNMSVIYCFCLKCEELWLLALCL